VSESSGNTAKILIYIRAKATPQETGSTPASIRRRQSWTAPEPHRFPSLGTLSMRSSMASSSDNLQPANPRLSSSESSTQEVSLLIAKPDVVSPPYELDALDNHDGARSQAAITLVREKERIRNEELGPLEERLRGLEAKHRELEDRLRRLQPKEAARPTDTHDQDDAVAQAVSGESSSSSGERNGRGLMQSDTVRYVRRGT
jgi:hypothetical protein